MKLQVELQNFIGAQAIPTTEQMQNWINYTTQALSAQQINGHTEKTVTIRIVDKQQSRDLNHTFRQKDQATNVLSFPNEPIPGIEDPLLGDIAICADIIREEAKAQQKAEQAHWAHLIIHGILHLLGFDHQTEQQAEEMEGLEIHILQQLGYANPYEE